jgi:hypothetical protein
MTANDSQNLLSSQICPLPGQLQKKNQKTFMFVARAVDMSATARKSFLLLFFKKEVLSY